MNQSTVWTVLGVFITIIGVSFIDGWAGTVVALVGAGMAVYGAVLAIRANRNRQD